MYTTKVYPRIMELKLPFLISFGRLRNVRIKDDYCDLSLLTLETSLVSTEFTEHYYLLA